MDLNKLRDEVHANAVAKGFWDEQLSDQHYLMLVITELSEAVEADRKGKRALKSAYICEHLDFGFSNELYDTYIKGSVEEELADAVIRLLDLAGAREVNLESVNHWMSICATHSPRSFTETIFSIATNLSKNSLSMSIARIFKVANNMDIDLEWHIEMKKKYNESREYKHGKKY